MRFILTVGLSLTFSPSFRLFMGCFVHVPLSQFQPSPAPLTHVHTQFPVLWAFSHSSLALARRTQSSISDAKKRKAIPADWLLTLLCKKYINPHWILTGEGPTHLQPCEDGAPVAFPVHTIVERRPVQECSMDELMREVVRRAMAATN